MIKHTEGPWDVGTKSNGVSPRHAQIFNDNGYIATVNYTNSIAETNSNATLIAAAPELLEALEAAIPLLHTGDELPLDYYKDKPSALGKALRAIAKAKGNNK